MHFGMLLTMRLGLFPMISITALLLFLPSTVWDTAAKFTEPMVSSRRMARLENRCRQLFPEFSFARIPSAISKSGRRIVPLVVAGLLLFVLVWNAATLGYVQTPDQVNDVVNPAEHRWSMFAPEPRQTDGWYVVPGTLESGTHVDAFHRSAVRWSRPSGGSVGFPSHRWLVYLLDLQRPGYESLRPEFTDYVCQRWNRNHEDDLVNVSVYYVRQPTNLDGPEPTERVKLTNHSCSA
ncbi:hypothetical protein [Haladaptatus sp.]|uniref:hypothetical protein n=1 Tax=Haladaptatus sp. TaxID=1973141 RepID=UPI003C3D264F